MENKITFDDIQRVNETIKTTDIKGKDYAEVNQRIKAFRMLYPNGTIHTNMISNENGVCIFKATIIDEKGTVLATGTAYEKEDSSFINKTSYIENCETSAVGRALGMCGIGIDTSVASYEEVSNAIANQGFKTIEEAKEYKLTFGKHSGLTLGEVIEKDINYCDWLLNNAQDPNVKVGISMITGVVIPSEDEQNEIMNLMIKMNELVRVKNYDYSKLLKFYKVKSNKDMTIEQLRDAVEKLEAM